MGRALHHGIKVIATLTGALALAAGLSAPASAATVSQRVAINDWHCSGGGSVVAILGFSNFPNGWTFYGTQPGNALRVSATPGQNYAYAAVTCNVRYWWGGSRTYHQEITSPMYYWAYSDGSGTKQL